MLNCPIATYLTAETVIRSLNTNYIAFIIFLKRQKNELMMCQLYVAKQ